LENSYKICKYNKDNYEVFKNMVFDYFTKDLKIDLTDKQLEYVCKEIELHSEKNIGFLDLIFENENPIGFISYQIDSKESDWCEKEGFGCIREFYIIPSHRKKGFGEKLVKHAENNLAKLSISDIYLTADDEGSIIFYNKMGYSENGEICLKNNCKIYIKKIV